MTELSYYFKLDQAVLSYLIKREFQGILNNRQALINKLMPILIDFKNRHGFKNNILRLLASILFANSDNTELEEMSGEDVFSFFEAKLKDWFLNSPEALVLRKILLINSNDDDRSRKNRGRFVINDGNHVYDNTDDFITETIILTIGGNYVLDSAFRRFFAEEIEKLTPPEPQSSPIRIDSPYPQ